MKVTLDPKTEKDLLKLARASRKHPLKVLRELLQQAVAGGKEAQRDLKPRGKSKDPAHERARTALGRKLRALSRGYVERGGKLLTVEEINREIAENRGER